jgi:hypothetical protein
MTEIQNAIFARLYGYLAGNEREDFGIIPITNLSGCSQFIFPKGIL